MNSALASLVWLAFASVFVLSLAWVAGDAQRRGRSATRVVFLCLVTWPLGFLIWRGVRPPPRLG